MDDADVFDVFERAPAKPFGIDWQPMFKVPLGERVFLFLERGEKGNGELAVGIVSSSTYQVDGKEFHEVHVWSWGGANAGGITTSEVPAAWAPLPEDWYNHALRAIGKALDA